MQQLQCASAEQGGSAEVYLHGAHVTSWKSCAGEVIPLSSAMH